jgi:hypothetical protein
MPGTSTHPLLQDTHKRRFFFAGTPYGDFDTVPAEASADFYKNYKLLINLGWNTMIAEDYDKTIEYVKNGGVLLTGIPQFSTHTKRDFLMDMKDLSLWNNGDLRELCGFKVLGIGEKYSGQWNSANRGNIIEAELSSHPSFDISEDGSPMLANIELYGGEVIAWDAWTGNPMLVRNKVGDGEIYTFTLWAYAGHEQFQKFAATWVEIISSTAAKSEAYLIDESREVFWTRWVDSKKTTMMILNTDWTKKGNVKNVTLVSDKITYNLSVKERSILIVNIENKEISTEEFCF